MERSYQRLLDGNRAWVKKQLAEDPEYFQKLSTGQYPEYLWIGCSDSRVSADQITGTQPGDIFVHRNIANVALHDDPNLLAVLQYSVDVLEVKHVILCGHYGCGGIGAALAGQTSGPMDDWLKNVREVYRSNRYDVDRIEDPQQRSHRLAELNVIAQTHNVCATSIIRESWARRGAPHVHGWIYSIADGILKELGVTVRGPSDVARIFGTI